MAKRVLTHSSSSLDCKQVELEIPWLVNGTLGDDKRRTIREHLIRCSRCRHAVNETREVFEIVRRAAQSEKTAFEAKRPMRVRWLPPAALKWAAMIVASIFGAVLVATMMPGFKNSKTARNNPETDALGSLTGDEGVVYADGFEQRELSGWVVYGEKVVVDSRTQ